SAPALDPTIVDFLPEALPRPVASVPQSAAPTAKGRSQSADGAGRPSDTVAAEKKQDEGLAVGEQQASAEYSAFQARFDIPGRTSVLATGEVKRVLIDEVKIEPT